MNRWTSGEGRCPVCLGGFERGWLVGARHDRVCPKHRTERVWCRFCRRVAFRAGRVVELPTGLDPSEAPVCPACAADAIVTERQGIPLVAEVVRWLIAAGADFPGRHPVRVELMNERAIEAHRPEESPDVLGLCSWRAWSQGDGEIRVTDLHVMLLRGMPANLFQSVAAHELGHAWLALHGAIHLPHWAAEGFCELIQHRWLTSRGTSEEAYHAEELAEQDDPYYGDGFRRVRALADRVGFAELLAALRETRRLPTFR